MSIAHIEGGGPSAHAVVSAEKSAQAPSPFSPSIARIDFLTTNLLLAQKPPSALAGHSIVGSISASLANGFEGVEVHVAPRTIENSPDSFDAYHFRTLALEGKNWIVTSSVTIMRGGDDALESYVHGDVNDPKSFVETVVNALTLSHPDNLTVDLDLRSPVILLN